MAEIQNSRQAQNAQGVKINSYSAVPQTTHLVSSATGQGHAHSAADVSLPPLPPGIVSYWHTTPDGNIESILTGGLDPKFSSGKSTYFSMEPRCDYWSDTYEKTWVGRMPQPLQRLLSRFGFASSKLASRGYAIEVDSAVLGCHYHQYVETTSELIEPKKFRAVYRIGMDRRLTLVAYRNSSGDLVSVGSIGSQDFTDLPEAKPVRVPQSRGAAIRDVSANGARAALLNPLVLLYATRSAASALSGDIEDAKKQAVAAAAVGGTAGTLSLGTDLATHFARQKIGPRAGAIVGVAGGAVVGLGFTAYNAYQMDGASRTSELITGSVEAVGSTAGTALLLKAGALKAGPIAGIMAYTDLFRFGSNVLTYHSTNGGNAPNPSFIQLTAQSANDYFIKDLIDRVQGSSVEPDHLRDAIENGPPATPLSASHYLMDYSNRLLYDSNSGAAHKLESAYRAYGLAKREKSAWALRLITRGKYASHHDDLAQYFSELSKYQDAAEIFLPLTAGYMAQREQFLSGADPADREALGQQIPALEVPALPDPTIDSNQFPRLASLAAAIAEKHNGRISVRELHDSLRENILSTEKPDINMIPFSAERRELFHEFTQYQLKQYIPYQASLLESAQILRNNAQKLEELAEQLNEVRQAA